MNGPDPFWDWIRRLRRPPAGPQVTLGPTEAVGYYASPELARQVDPVQAGLLLGARQSNVPAMQRSQAQINAQGTSFPGALADVAANNLVDVVLPGDYSQFDERAMERAGDPTAPLFSGRLQEMLKAHPRDVGPTRADAYGLAAAGGAVGGNLGLNAAIPNVGNLTPGMNPREIGLALLRGGAVEGLTGGALAYGDAVGQGMAPGEAFRHALPQAGIQAGLGMAFRGLHGRPVLREAGLDPNVRDLLPSRRTMTDLWDRAEAALTGGPSGLTPHQEYQVYVDAGQVPPRRVLEAMDAQDARVNAEEAGLGISRPAPVEPSLFPNLASERGAVGAGDIAPDSDILYHGTNADFDVPRMESQSFNDMGLLGNVPTERHGFFLTDNPEFASEYGTPRQFKVNAESVADINANLRNQFLDEMLESGRTSEADHQIALTVRYGNQWKPWLLFEGDVGKRFTGWLRDQGYDAARFEEFVPTKAGGEVGGQTTVLLDPAKARRVGAAPDLTSPQAFHDHFFGQKPSGEEGMIGTFGIQSRLPKSIQAAKLEKAPAQTWVSKLRGAGNNASEFDWVVGEVLRRDPQRVWTRQQLLDLADGKGIKISERTLGGEQAKIDWEERPDGVIVAHLPESEGGRAKVGLGTIVPTKDGGFKVAAKGRENMTYRSREAAQEYLEAVAREEFRSPEDTKYGKWQLPGGENYREVLVKLVQPNHGLPEGFTLRERGKGKNTTWAVYGPEGAKPPHYGTAYSPEDALAAFRSHPHGATSAGFTGSHWDDPNVLVHLRLNDRTVNGEKVLFIEEVQSDWMQKGRKHGWRRERLTPERRAELQGAKEALEARFRDEGRDATDAEAAEWKRLRDELHAEEFERPDAVPDVPGMFKDTPQWTLLGLKRALDEAVAGGYDRMAWTTGAQQAERYDLSKVVDEVQYDPDSQTLITFGEGGRQHFSDVPPNELEEYIGKEGAERLLAAPREGEGERWDVATQSWSGGGTHVLRGADLKVGGEGMRGYYDQILPDALKAYGKKLGVRLDIEPTPIDGVDGWNVYDSSGNPVTEESLPTREAAEEWLARYNEDVGGDEVYQILGANEGGSTNQSIRITPELRSKIQGGQELGQGAPAMMGGMAGGIGGAAYGATQGDTPEERAKNALLYGAAGLAGGAGIGRLAENAPLARLFGDIETPLLRGEAHTLLPDLGNERGALGVTDTPEFRNFFGQSKVVDEAGQPKVVYHGTQRPDRVGTRFRASRANSGPMQFFTDSPEMASNYAKGKADTSLEVGHYNEWFTMKPKGARNPVPLDKGWWSLSPEERARVAELAPRVTLDDDGNIVLGPEGHDYGTGAYDQHLREARGNHFAALVEEWLSSGNLFNDEARFQEVLKLAGVDPGKVTFDDPNAAYPAVFPVHLKIENPLDTSDIPEDVMDALRTMAKRSRTRPAPGGVDPWDKRSRDIRDWVQELERARETGENSFVWTSIPDQVTEVLRRLGYDGIKDVGGKMGGDPHTVWVPFGEKQIKSATGNRGTFDPTSANITLGLGALAVGSQMMPDEDEPLPSRVQSLLRPR